MGTILSGAYRQTSQKISYVNSWSGGLLKTGLMLTPAGLPKVYAPHCVQIVGVNSGLAEIRYSSDALVADVQRGTEKLLIKYDPQDLSRTFIRRLSGSSV
jgi:hypothetical protein